MEKIAKTKDVKPKGDVRSGLALAITFFIISIFLHFQSHYFDIFTTTISIICIVFGFFGMGTELNKLVSGQPEESFIYKRGTGIFDNLGFGLGVFIIWVAIFKNYPYIWINTILSPLLFFGTYGILLGLVNILFSIVEPTFDHEEKPKRFTQSIVIKIITIFSGVIGFIASFLQILQFLKII